MVYNCTGPAGKVWPGSPSTRGRSAVEVGAWANRIMSCVEESRTQGRVTIEFTRGNRNRLIFGTIPTELDPRWSTRPPSSQDMHTPRTMAVLAGAG